MAMDYVMVAAIDFGTTFSGYAFSFKSNPEDIKMNKNWGTALGFQVISLYRNNKDILDTLVLMKRSQLAFIIFKSSFLKIRKSEMMHGTKCNA